MIGTKYFVYGAIICQLHQTFKKIKILQNLQCLHFSLFWNGYIFVLSRQILNKKISQMRHKGVGGSGVSRKFSKTFKI